MPVGIRRSLSAGVVSLCVLFGGLVFGSVPALATEPPEAPTAVVVEGLTETSAIFGGELSPHQHDYFAQPYTYEFLYRKSSVECEGESKTPEPPALSKERGEEVLPSLEVRGLEAHTEYTVCLLARNSVGEEAVGPAVTFRTLPAPPTVASESVEYVEASAATLNAEFAATGLETTYRFEYGATETYGQSTPGSVLVGDDDLALSANARVTGLEPGTTYHYRVVATNSLSPGGVFGPDKTFTTPPAPRSTSPQHCENEKLRLEQPYGVKLPDCRAYEMVSPVETEGYDATGKELYHDGEVVSPPEAAVSGEAVAYVSIASFADPTGSGSQNEFLSRRGPGGWSTQGIAPLHDPFHTEVNFSSYENGIFTPELTAGVMRTNAQLTSEAPPPTEGEGTWGLYVDDFASGSYRYVGEGQLRGIAVLGASIDLSHVVFGERGSLSEWVNGKVLPVGIAPDGEEISARTEGLHVVSPDGSRVFFINGEQVYLRENAEREQSALGAGGECVEAAKACTVAISPGAARFWGANAEGSEAFFTEGEELDRYDVESGQTVALAGTVQGVVQVSEDGSYVYFVAKGALKGAGGAILRNGQGAEPVAGEDNVYLVHAGATQFVATLAGNDGGDWGAGLAENNAVVAPGGGWLAFMSERSLTGYDNEQAKPGECKGEAGRCPELFLYDAETGGVECASCDPTGARPIGESSLSAAYGKSQYRPRALVEDGALFFDSSDALVPHASDGRQNVYEYEDGHVYAISNVAGGFESFFLDASASGDDVFFATADQLLPQDVSNNVVVYDARVDGGFPVSVSPPPCDNGDSCKPPPTPQPAVFGAPASATFSGAGNITATPVAPTSVKSAKKVVKCTEGKKLTHGKCGRKKTVRKPKAKKSSHGTGSN